MRNVWTTAACVLIMSVIGRGADNPLLQNVDRRIQKEPGYIARRPFYGLLVFGPTPQKRIWMVLDQSKPTAERYDVIFVDLDADGDLTDPAERVVGQVEGDSVRFHLPDLKDPVTGAVHTRFTARVLWYLSADRHGERAVEGSLQDGRRLPRRPGGEIPGIRRQTRDRAADVAHGDGPFRFQRWYSGKLSIGGADDFKVFVGQQGRGQTASGLFNSTSCRHRKA